MLRILSIDDDDSNQVVTKAMLSNLGHSCVTCHSGKAGLEFLQKEPFDLVLMDLKMPDLDGFEATRLIYELFDGSPPFKIFALTANIFEDIREECIQAGMEGLIRKPVTLKEFRQVLESLNSNVRI